MVAGSAKRISPDSVDPTVKNYHWGDMTRALFEALDAGYDTVVLPDDRGMIKEGTGFNIFAVIDGRVVTPKSGALHGITRRTVMEICDDLEIPCDAIDIPVDEFLEADEVFTATTGGGPVSVTRVNNTILGNDAPGPVTGQVINSYWNWHQKPELITKIVYK